MAHSKNEIERRTANVKSFINAVVELAIRDAEAGMPDRAPRNTGQMLRTRLNFNRHRVCSRNGDMRYARMIYTSARFLYATEEMIPAITNQPEQAG